MPNELLVHKRQTSWHDQPWIHESSVVLLVCDVYVLGFDLIIVDILLRAISGSLSFAWRHQMIKFVQVKHADANTPRMN